MGDDSDYGAPHQPSGSYGGATNGPAGYGASQSASSPYGGAQLGQQQKSQNPKPTSVKTKPPQVAAIEVGIYSVNQFTRHPQCKQPPLDYCNTVAGGFGEAMKARGHKWAFVKRDQDFSPLQWNAATDQDPGGVDTVEVAYIASHGRTDGTELGFSHALGHSQWLYWFLTNCDSADGCWISTIVLKVVSISGRNTWRPPDAKHPQTAMRLGGGRLRWVVLDCCRSQQMRDVNETEKDAKDKLAETTPGETWGRCYDGVHMLFGFTGLSSDASWTKDRGKAFGKRAGRGEALAESWIDEAYCWVVLDGVDTPVVTAFGQSPAEANQRLKSESLKNPGSPPTRPIRSFFYSSIWRS